MKEAAADLESRRGTLSPTVQNSYGVKFLDFESFCRFWQRVCQIPALKQRWLDRLELGFGEEKAQIARMVEELVGGEKRTQKNAA
jgi:hypothetical protein